MKIIDGKKHAREVLNQLHEEIQRTNKQPHLVIIMVGDHPASSVYVKNKLNRANEVGMKSTLIHLNEACTQQHLIDQINELNENEDVHGILVQLPLPNHLNTQVIQETIKVSKDVDGLHPLNVGYMVTKDSRALVSCTPMGIMSMLKQENIDIDGKQVVVMGRSQIVGIPMAHLMLQANATVSIVHSKTKNIKAITKQADILIVAIGQPQMVDSSYIKEGAIVIDVGIHRTENGLVGDCLYDDIKNKASRITPVPGGVGPMTIAMLCVNTYQAMLKGGD